MARFELIDVEKLNCFWSFDVRESARHDPDSAATVLHVEHLHRLEFGRRGAVVDGFLPVTLEALAPLLLEFPALPELYLVVEGFPHPCALRLRLPHLDHLL